MLKHAPLFLALRYLRPRRSFVSVITIISILGVMVGVLMMVVVRSVMHGFEVDFRENLMRMEPHVLISKDSKVPNPGPWNDVVEAARALPDTRAAAPIAAGVLLIANGEAQTSLQAFGFAPAEAGYFVAKLQEHLLEGSLSLEEGTLVLSDIRANQLGVAVGDAISVYPSQDVNQMVRRFRSANDEEDKEKKKAAYEQIKLRPRELKVSGILRSTAGGNAGYMSLNTGQAIFDLGGEVTGIVIELKNPEEAAGFAQALKGAAPGWTFQLWTDGSKVRLAAMKTEQFVMLFVLLIIALVAAFSVMNTTITVTTQKRREIGVITALGAGKGLIVKIFLYQSLIVGVIGTGAGLAGSLLVLRFRNEIRSAMTAVTGGQVGAVEGIFQATVPADIQPWYVALICGASIVLCVLAGWLPAWFAAKVDPAVALRD